MKTVFGRTGDNYYLKQLKQDTKVRFNTGIDMSGEGLIKGISGSGATFTGISYIIEVTMWNDENEYKKEYSHISLPEIYLDVIEE